MVEIYATQNPEQRIYVDGVSVKFRGGAAEVSDELAEVLLLREGFSASPEGDSELGEAEIEAAVETRLAVEVERVTTEVKAAIEAEAEARISAEAERITAEAEAKIEAEVERRVAEAIAASGTSATGDEAPAKRGPGRPKKTDAVE